MVMRKSLKSVVLILGCVSLQFFFPLPVCAESAPVTGTIQNITENENGQMTLTLENEGQTAVFRVDRNTVVQMMSPARQLKKGRRVLGASEKRGDRGGKGPKMPFQNMSAKTKKMLGLSGVPELPEIPSLPEVPKAPKIPKIPKISGKEAGGGEAGTEAQKEKTEGAGAEEAEPAPAGGQAAKSRTVPKAVTPEKDTLAKLIPDKPIFPTGSVSAFEIKQVVNLKTTPAGIEIELKGKKGASEKLVVAPDDPFVQLLDVKELKRGMKVSADLTESGGGSVAQQITVL